jgi:hypothetical protein
MAKKIIVRIENCIQEFIDAFAAGEKATRTKLVKIALNCLIKGVSVKGEVITCKDKAAYSDLRKLCLKTFKANSAWPEVDGKKVNEKVAKKMDSDAYGIGNAYNRLQSMLNDSNPDTANGNRVSDSAEIRLAKALARYMAILNLDSEELTIDGFIEEIGQVDVFKTHLDKCLEKDAK